MKFRKKTFLSIVCLCLITVLYLAIKAESPTAKGSKSSSDTSLNQFSNSHSSDTLEELKNVSSSQTKKNSGYDIVYYGSASVEYANAVTNVSVAVKSKVHPKKGQVSFDELTNMSLEELKVTRKLQTPTIGTIEKFGVLLVIYPQKDSDYYYRRIYNQALLLRELESNIKICLLSPAMSQLKMAVMGHVINRFEQIPQELNGDSFKMVHAMKLSPFEITLIFDQDMIFCSSFISDILPFFELVELDLVYSGLSEENSVSRVGDADLGVLLYRLNDKFSKVLEKWIGNLDGLGDMSTHFHKAIYDYRFELKIGRFSSSFGGRFRPATDIQLTPGIDYPHYHTLAITGKVRFFQISSKGTLAFNSEMCQFLNSNIKSRVILWNKLQNPNLTAYNLGYSLQLASSQTSCNKLLGSDCFDVSWEHKKLINVLIVPEKAVNNQRVGLIYSAFDLENGRFREKMTKIINSVLSVRNVEPDVDITLISHGLFPDTISKVSKNFDNVVLVID